MTPSAARIIQNYEILETFYEDSHEVIYSAINRKTGKKLFLKTYKGAEAKSRLSEEQFFLEQNELPGFPSFVEMFNEGTTTFLAFQCFGKVPLQAEIASLSSKPAFFLEVAFHLAQFVDAVHKKGFLLLDLDPNALLWNAETKTISFLNFGSATKAAHDGLYPKRMPRNLAFCSPEQTGRANRSLDDRTDIYSLGMLLNYLATGRLPLKNADSLKWIHFHLAFNLQSVNLANTNVTKALDLVLAKMTAKAKDERYQSAGGVAHDLQQILTHISDSEYLNRFQAGTKDYSNHLTLSQTLYGRENEIAELNKHLEIAAHGGLDFLFLGGQAGIGKSSLVQEFLSKVDTDKNLFVTGKYRLLEQSEHLQGLIEAFDQIVSKKIISEDKELKSWLSRLTDHLGNDWTLLCEKLPNLKPFAPKVETPQILNPGDSRARLQDCLFQFLVASATIEQPIILFIDDIQWFDQSTCDFLLKLATDGNARNLFVICSYRSEEVSPIHLVNTLKKGVIKAQISFSELELKPINTNEIRSLISDSLKPVAGSVQELVEVIERKTNGNPFFVKRMLYHIFEQEILYRDDSHAWTWKIEAIANLPASANVLELLTAKIKSLDDQLKHTLTLISCFPGKVQRALVESIFFNSDSAIYKNQLSELEAENYIFIDREDNIVIFHDRIREAAYQLADLEQKSAIHKKIGLALLASIQVESTSYEHMFSCVSQLNKGVDATDPLEFRLKLANLNYEIAKKAKQSGAFELGLQHVEKASEVLTIDEKQMNSSLTWNLDFLYADFKALTGQPNDALMVFQSLVDRHAATELKVEMYQAYANLLHAEGRYNESIEISRRGLAELKFRLPKNASKFRLLLNIVHNQFLLKRIGIKNFSKIKSNQDERLLQIQKLFIIISGNAYFIDRLMFAYMVVKNFQYIIKYGARPEVTHTGYYYVIIMAHQLGKFKEAYELGQQISKLIESQGNHVFSHRGGFAYPAFLIPFARPIDEAKDLLEQSIHHFKKMGDAASSSHAALYLSHHQFYSGENLESVFDHSKSLLYLIRPTADQMISDSLFSYSIFSARLMNLNADAICNENKMSANLSEYVARISAYKIPNGKAWFGTCGLVFSYIMRDLTSARNFMKFSAYALEATPYTYSPHFHHLMSCLVNLEILKTEPQRKNELLKIVEPSLKILKRWAGVNEQNFAAIYLIAKAEYEASKGEFATAISDLIDAVERSIRGKNLMLQAMASENAGRLYLANKQVNAGYRLLADAVKYYREWKAQAKVAQLLSEFPSLVSMTSAIQVGSTAETENVKLDVMSVLKSCQVIGNEMDLNVLLKEMTFLLNENAGAESGKIFLKKDENLFLKARSSGADAENVQLTDTQLADVKDIAHSIVNYVLRTKEPMVIIDAQTNELTKNDLYIRTNKSRSILCMPLINKHQLTGIIWLENNSSPGMFTKQRLEALNILASQAAISFENARLFGQEQEKLRMEGELMVAKTVQNTLFKEPNGRTDSFRIAGSFEPASECGGDWWHYGAFNDVEYFCIGDATGHGVPAALITSAVRSAVASVEYVKETNASRIASLLNNSVAQTSKGQINMTLFMGVYNKKTAQFTYANCSHEPTFHIPHNWINDIRNLAKTDRVAACRQFRLEIALMAEVSGPSLGSKVDSDFSETTINVQPHDYMMCYTDGIPEMFNASEAQMGERAFIMAVAETFIDHTDIDEIRDKLAERWAAFRGKAALKDDVTFFITQLEPNS